MMVVSGFLQSAQVAQALGLPELAGAFETKLPLAAGRFDRATANGPPASGNLLT